MAENNFTIENLRTQSAEGWHETYETHGREVTVDIDINVPDTASLPIYKMDFALSEMPAAKEVTDLVIDGRVEDNVVWFNTPYFPEPVSGKIEKLPAEAFDSPSDMKKAYAQGIST